MDKIEDFVAYLFEALKRLDSSAPGHRIETQAVYQCLYDSCGEWLEKNTNYFDEER